MISLIAKSVLCSVNSVYAVKVSKPRKKNKYRHLVQLQPSASVSRISQSTIRGIDYLKDNRLCKGLALTLKERQALGLQGLLAPGYQSQEQQLEICQLSVGRYKDNLNKYLYLAELQDTNEKLFYSLLNTNIEKFMPIVYTPTVGLACQKFGITYKKPRGLFISYLDKGHIGSVLRNWPEADVRAIVFTDGERILGLGDLGAYGMGIPVGKLSLYTALAGIKPHQCLPITLDLGTENESLLSDPLYIGLRQKRVRGKEYDEFIDEFMQACKREYGPNTLMQFEDFAQLNAATLLERYRNKYCTFNDDIQGTASVSVAGLFTACRITKTKLSDHTVMFLGAGSAACGIANLVVLAMTQDGVDEASARQKIFMFDKDGLLTNKRSAAIPDSGKVFAKDVQPIDSFSEAVATLKPTVLIGASTVAGAFTPEILQQMAKNTERPVIFALSNPTSKAECSPQVAYDNTEGRCLFASGSPFPPVNYNGKTYITGQGNNSYIFPGLALGILATYSYVIPEVMFLNAAQTLADNISQEDLDLGRLYPPLSEVKKLSLDIAINTAKMAYELDTATLFPKPKDMKAYILENHTYDLKYDSYLPPSYVSKLPEWELRKISEVYPTQVDDRWFRAFSSDVPTSDIL